MHSTLDETSRAVFVFYRTKIMKALSIRQPWVWAILDAGKDIENRDWSTNIRGTIAIHAAKGMARHEWDDAREFMSYFMTEPILPRYEDFIRGAIVGTVDITDCVNKSPSPWFQGRFGFVLENAHMLSEPIPYSGALGFWDVPRSIEEIITRANS